MPCPVPAGGIVPWQASRRRRRFRRHGQRRRGPARHEPAVHRRPGRTAPSATTYMATIDGGSIGAWSEGRHCPKARADAGDRDRSAARPTSSAAWAGRRPDGHGLDARAGPDSGALGTWAAVHGRRRGDITCGARAAHLSSRSPMGSSWPVARAEGQSDRDRLEVDPRLRGTARRVQRPAEPPHPSRTRASPSRARSCGSTAARMRTARPAESSAPTTARPRPRPAARHPASRPPRPAPAGPSRHRRPAAPSRASCAGPSVTPSTCPAPRTGGGSFAANGALYLVGGSGRTWRSGELYWAIPDASGNLPAAGATSTPPTCPRASRTRPRRVRLDCVPARRRRAMAPPPPPCAPASRPRTVLPARHRRGRRAGAPDRRRDRPAARLPGRGRRGHGQLRDPRDNRLGVQQPRADQRLDGAPQGPLARRGQPPSSARSSPLGIAIPGSLFRHHAPPPITRSIRRVHLDAPARAARPAWPATRRSRAPRRFFATPAESTGRGRGLPRA